MLKGSPALSSDPILISIQTLRRQVIVPEKRCFQTFAYIWLLSTFQTGVEYNPRADELSHCANERTSWKRSTECG